MGLSSTDRCAVSMGEEFELGFGQIRSRIESLFDYSPDILYFLDPDGRISEISAIAEKKLGFSLPQLRTMNYVELVCEADRAATVERFARAIGGDVQSFETGLCDVDGHTIEFEVVSIPVEEHGEIVGVFGVARDVSQRKEVERQLQASEQRYRALFEDNIDAVLTFDLDGRFVAVNHATERMTGYEASALIGRSFLPFIVPELQEYTFEQFSRVREGKSVQYETAMYNSAGEVVDLHITVIPVTIDGQLDGVHCIGKDITQRNRLEAALNEMAYHDHLTGLPNQRAMQRELDELQAARTPYAVLILDLDRFKSVNDSWGHEVGDLLLRAVTNRLSTGLPEHARLFRYGGDELVAVLRTADESAMVQFAEQLQSRFNDPFVILDHEVVMSSSIGIACFPQDGDSAETIFRKADNAMYFAKQHGRNTFAVYHDVATPQSDQLLKLELELRGALRKGELSVVYQPQIDLRTGELHGLEALARWQSPAFGAVAPLDFIPIAEESGLIVEMGTWVLESACAQLAEWRDRGLGKLRVAVNTSIHQLDHEDFVPIVQRLLETYRLDPSQIVIEITESIASNADVIVARLSRLKELGIRIAIDDFGTGYSSLQYLKDYPVDYLKIDRSFLEKMEQNQADRDLVSTIITLAHNLGLATVAEGAETAVQMAFLREHESDFAQGLFYSEPLSAGDFERWLAERSS